MLRENHMNGSGGVAFATTDAVNCYSLTLMKAQHIIAVKWESSAHKFVGFYTGEIFVLK